VDTGAARGASGSDAGIAVRVMEACWVRDAAAVLLALVDDWALRQSLLAGYPLAPTHTKSFAHRSLVLDTSPAEQFWACARKIVSDIGTYRGSTSPNARKHNGRRKSDHIYGILTRATRVDDLPDGGTRLCHWAVDFSNC